MWWYTVLLIDNGNLRRKEGGAWERRHTIIKLILSIIQYSFLVISKYVCNVCIFWFNLFFVCIFNFLKIVIGLFFIYFNLIFVYKERTQPAAFDLKLFSSVYSTCNSILFYFFTFIYLSFIFYFTLNTYNLCFFSFTFYYYLF